MNSPEVVALMLADGRLPTGGHTQSAGLEPAVRAGLGADGKQLGDVASYARDRLRTIVRVEAATAVVARHVVLTSTADRSPSPSRGFVLENPRVASTSPRLSADSAETARHGLSERAGLDVPEAPKLRASEHPVPSRGFVLDVGSQDPRLSANSVEAAGESARLGVPDRAGLDVPQLPELQVSARPAPGAVEHSTREASEQSTPETASPEAPGSQASGSEASGSEASGSEASGAEPAGSGAEAGERSGAKVVERLGAEVAEGLGMVEGAWAARTPSQALRGASRRQGRVYLRLAARVWPEVLRYLPANGEVARPVVVGVIGAVNGLSAEQVARLIAYDDVQTVVAASLKLLPVDPADAACWLAGLQDDIERLVTDVAPLTEIEKIPANGAPLIDLFAQNHATERMRLFHA